MPDRAARQNMRRSIVVAGAALAMVAGCTPQERPAAVVSSGPVASPQAQAAATKGFAAALKGCEEWVLNPASWASGTEPFIQSMGLGNGLRKLDRVDAAYLPPPQLRLANHYWRIEPAPGVALILVVSDRLPMCHITGTGNSDLQPAIEAVLSSKAFTGRWKLVRESARDGILSSQYRSTKEAKFWIVVSRPTAPGPASNGTLVIATAQYELRN